MAGCVDWDARTISGIAVPYGPVGHRAGRRYRFAVGSVTFPFRVRLLIDHDQSLRAGRATEIVQTATGPLVTFAVPSGPEGDRTLAFAERAGLSIGDLDQVVLVRDPLHPGVRLVSFAVAREVSLTIHPVFDWR